MLGFEQIVGHEKIKEHFKQAALHRKFSHAYILNGEDGSGKGVLAKVFAAALQCEREGEGELPCGECRSCKQMESGNQPDVIWVRSDKASIGVDVVREQINATAHIKPFQSDLKVYVVPNADDMTEQAQNALLKTMEEPPSYVVLLLLVEDVERLLPTILSRCMTIYLKPIADEQVVEYLIRECKVPDYTAKMSATFAQGNLGKAIRYAASEDFAEMKDRVMLILRHMGNMKVHEMVEAIKWIKQKKENVDDYLDLMGLWYRDVLLFKATNDANNLIFMEEFKYIAKEAGIRDYERLDSIIGALETAKIRLEANVNFDITMELLFLTLKDV